MPITITVQIEEREGKLLVEMQGKRTGQVTQSEGLMGNALKRGMDLAQEAAGKIMGKTVAHIDLQNHEGV